MAKPRKSNDLFATLNAINNKRPIIYDKKEASAYMLMMWLSHDRYLMPWVNKINENLFNPNLSDEHVFKYFYEKIPKKNRFIKWIKKDKVGKNKLKLVKDLCETFNISKKEAKSLLQGENL